VKIAIILGTGKLTQILCQVRPWNILLPESRKGRSIRNILHIFTLPRHDRLCYNRGNSTTSAFAD
jgi:hypothetical protein